ncbi:MAG: PRC-barrel domain containing protein [Planctomycetes bacterium]|nr:PRC-barrel domain containing protein [Planctomycetota bacterium]
MLRSVNNLEGFSLGAKDGEIGNVYSLIFDSQDWAIRYFVVDTGRWLPGRKVLISPNALERPDWQGRILHVNLTKDQVHNAPEIDTDLPVSRQRELELHRYYGWTPYWGPVHGVEAAPERYAQPQADRGVGVMVESVGDSHLRSTREVRGYRIHATDGQIGHVEDFILSDEDWVIRYLVVDTRNWLPGRSVLISPEWVTDIGWEEREVWVDVPKQTIEQSPNYDASAPINREYETRMYDYYGRPRYWSRM